MAIRMSVEDRVTQSSFVGVVTVMSTTATWAVNLPEEERLKHYLQVASVRVVQTIKGQDTPATFQLEFDNGLGWSCPTFTHTGLS
jgi:hypothetical protein